MGAVKWEEFHSHYYERYRAEETLGRELLRRAELLPVFPCVYVCSAIWSSLGSSYWGYLPDCVPILTTPSIDGHQPKQAQSVCPASILMSGFDTLIFQHINFKKSHFMCIRWGYNHLGSCLDKRQGTPGWDIRQIYEFVCKRIDHLPIPSSSNYLQWKKKNIDFVAKPGARVASCTRSAHLTPFAFSSEGNHIIVITKVKRCPRLSRISSGRRRDAQIWVSVW